jgi:EAL domain-containing protein (putative c-di-GMP-specific phosphodiesterase class I)
VESERLTLLDLGCFNGQGYLFARPGAPDAIGRIAPAGIGTEHGAPGVGASAS